MQRIAESELIINDRGTIYHLDVRPEELGDFVITVGDPSRVPAVSKYLDHIECQCNHRPTQRAATEREMTRGT